MSDNLIGSIWSSLTNTDLPVSVWPVTTRRISTSCDGIFRALAC
jgi:hypothetical protein